MKKSTIGIIGFVSALSGSLALAAPVHTKGITEAEVLAAQHAWGAALLQISQDNMTDGLEKATATATTVIETAYAYAHGPVLFKPTLASGDTTFRITQEGALSYFVGGNANFPDSGFALKDWQDYVVENAAIFIDGQLAITMGHVILTNTEGEVTTVDKTWGFKKDDHDNIRIVLHHSSLPYSAE